MQRLSGHMSLPRGRRQAQIQPPLHVGANCTGTSSEEKLRGSSLETDNGSDQQMFIWKACSY